jgi:hypothetical protein
MNLFPLKATSTYVKAYYAALVQLHQGGHKAEGNTRSAFADVLKRCASAYEWHLVEEYQFKGTGKQSIRLPTAAGEVLPPCVTHLRGAFPPATPPSNLLFPWPWQDDGRNKGELFRHRLLLTVPASVDLILFLFGKASGMLI